jgi:hypothetical protein
MSASYIQEHTLINATTDAIASNEFSIIGNNICTVVVSGNLSAGEIISIQIKDPSTQTWSTCKIDNKVYQLSSQTNYYDIYQSAGKFRVSKSATSSAVSVGMFSTNQISIEPV